MPARREGEVPARNKASRAASRARRVSQGGSAADKPREGGGLPEGSQQG